jgi:hypothetical protein
VGPEHSGFLVTRVLGGGSHPSAAVLASSVQRDLETTLWQVRKQERKLGSRMVSLIKTMVVQDTQHARFGLLRTELIKLIQRDDGLI